MGRICAAIQTRGLSDTAAVREAGSSEVTLWRWKQKHPGLADRLAQARQQYRKVMLATPAPVQKPGEQPGWRTAARALRKAFPSEYRSPAETLRALRKKEARLGTRRNGGPP